MEAFPLFSCLLPLLVLELGMGSTVCRRAFRLPAEAVCSVAAAAGSMPAQGYVLEGFPATAAQARLLEKALTGLDLEQEAAMRAGASKLAPPPATAFPDPDRSLVSGGLSVWWTGSFRCVPMIWLQPGLGRHHFLCCFQAAMRVGASKLARHLHRPRHLLIAPWSRVGIAQVPS